MSSCARGYTQTASEVDTCSWEAVNPEYGIKSFLLQQNWTTESYVAVCYVSVKQHVPSITIHANSSLLHATCYMLHAT